MGILDKAINKVGSLVGMGGGQGEYYQPPTLDTKGVRSLNSALDARTSGNVQKAIQGMQSGGMSLADALKGLSPDEQSALAASPIGAQLVASDQVRNDPLSSGLLGKDGSLSRALTEEKDLASRGYSLQPEDYEAYGQGQDNIARMFGASEQSLASSLSDRGLAAAPSGAAAVQFSGLQGNKNEQLGQLQRSIANDRMNNTMQRLNSVRNYNVSLGNLGQNALDRSADRNVRADQNSTNLADQAAKAEAGQWSDNQAAQQASAQSKADRFDTGLAGALQEGISQGVTGATSGIIGGGGSSLSSSLFNKAPAAAAPKKNYVETTGYQKA